MSQREFSFSDLVALLKKRWYILVVAALIGAAALAFYSIAIYVPEYTSTVTFYVRPSSEDMNLSEYSTDEVSKVNWALKMINSYISLIKTGDYAQLLNDEYQKVYPEEYKKFGISYNSIKNALSTTMVEETSLFRLSFATPYVDGSFHLAELSEKLALDYIAQVSNLKDTVHVADSAKKSTAISNSDYLKRNTAIGFVGGAFLAFVFVFLIEFFDVRVKSEENLLNTYTLPLLGSIPNFTSESKSNTRGYYKYGY